MRVLRLIALVLVVLLLGACSCRSKKVGPEEVNVPVAQEKSELRDINFAFDSSALDSTAKAILESNAAWLRENGSSRVQVEGHCDERGTSEYNMALGERRARSAFDYLRSLGVVASRISTVSYGEELPLDPRHNEEAWAKNRRVHFNVQR